MSSDFPETLFPEMRECRLENIFSEIIVDANDKLEPVQKIIKKYNLNLNNTFFVGDSNHEIDIAKETGIKSVAVTWGFTSEQKLSARDPNYIVHNVQELESLIL